MKYLVTKIKFFIIFNKSQIDLMIIVLVYLLCIASNLSDITHCSPTPGNSPFSGCEEAHKLALENLKKNYAEK